MEAGTVPEKAVISHRGEKYEIGRGKRFYGIWVLGAPYDAPVDRWPENPDGWRQAWTRFTAIEAPGTIEPVTRERVNPLAGLRRPAAGPGAGEGEPGDGKPAARSRHGSLLLAGEGLLVLGVVLGLAGLFPAYYRGSQSLLAQSAQVVPHLCYIIGWALTAALVALSVARPNRATRLGALFGLGLSVVTFGLFLADWGQLADLLKPGLGLVVSSLGWLACTAGTVLVLGAGPGRGQRRPRPARPALGHAGPLALLVLAGIGTAASFAPSWDKYVLVARALGTSQTITAGNAFSNPSLAVAGNVCAMAAIVIVAVAAALWNPPRHGALLLAGAIVPFAAQFASALIQASQPASPALFGISSAQASSAQLTISSGLTGVFWVYFVFIIALVVSCAWLYTEPGHQVMPGMPASPWQPAEGEPGEHAAPDATVSEESEVEAESVTGQGAHSASPEPDSDR